MQTTIKFNPDTMTVTDLKACAESLKDILRKAKNNENNQTIAELVYYIAERYHVE